MITHTQLVPEPTPPTPTPPVPPIPGFLPTAEQPPAPPPPPFTVNELNVGHAIDRASRIIARRTPQRLMLASEARLR